MKGVLDTASSPESGCTYPTFLSVDYISRSTGAEDRVFDDLGRGARHSNTSCRSRICEYRGFLIFTQDVARAHLPTMPLRACNKTPRGRGLGPAKHLATTQDRSGRQFGGVS